MGCGIACNVVCRGIISIVFQLCLMFFSFLAHSFYCCRIMVKGGPSQHTFPGDLCCSIHSVVCVESKFNNIGASLYMQYVPLLFELNPFFIQ